MAAATTAAASRVAEDSEIARAINAFSESTPREQAAFRAGIDRTRAGLLQVWSERIAALAVRLDSPRRSCSASSGSASRSPTTSTRRCSSPRCTAAARRSSASTRRGSSTRPPGCTDLLGRPLAGRAARLRRPARGRGLRRGRRRRGLPLRARRRYGARPPLALPPFFSSASSCRARGVRALGDGLAARRRDGGDRDRDLARGQALEAHGRLDLLGLQALQAQPSCGR